jgi:hypothetical protein
MGFLKILFKVLVLVFKPLFWLFDKISEWDKKRPLSRKIWHSRLWILFYTYLAVYRWAPPSFAEWVPYVFPSEPGSFYVKIGLTAIWTVILINVIKTHKKIFVHTHNTPVEIGQIIAIGPGEDNFFVVTKCTAHPQSKRLWNLKVRRANQKERIVTSVMAS